MDQMLQILEYLKKLGIESISDKEKQILLERIKSGDTVEAIKKELELLYAINKVMIKSYSKVSIANMYKIDQTIDNELYIKLFTIYSNIKKRSLSHIDTLKEFRKLTRDILNRNEKVNKVIKKEVKESIDKVSDIKNVLYFSMEDKQKADKLFHNCEKKLKTFIDQCDTQNLETMILYLKNNFDFTDDELVKISSKCATFFAFSSASKIQNLHTTLENFKGFILSRLKGDAKEASIGKSIDKNFKELLFTNSSLATTSSEVLNKTIRFLMGEKLGDITDDAHDIVKDIRGNFTPRQLAKIYSDSISSLLTSVEKIGDFSYNINRAFFDCYGKSLDVNNLITGRNFANLAQLTTRDYDNSGKVKKIFKLLKPFLSKEEMEKLLQNNCSFLIASESEVKTALKKAILTSKNNDELKANVLQKIKNHFDRYEGLYEEKAIKREPKISIESGKRVALNTIEEENILKMLEELDSSEEEIEKWKYGWNKEEKEIRDLQIQLELEDILEKINRLKEMSSIVFKSIDQYEDEAEVFYSLYSEIMDEYELVIGGVKLNKELKELSKAITVELENTKKITEGHFIYLKDLYKERMDSINNELNGYIKEKGDYDNLIGSVESIDVELGGEKVYARLDVYTKETEEIENFIKSCEERVKYIEELCKETSRLLNELGKGFESKKMQLDTKNKDRLLGRFNNPGYMCNLIIYLIVKEVPESNQKEEAAFNLFQMDLDMTFDDLFNKLTPEEQNKVVRVKKLYIEGCTLDHKILQEAREKLKEYGIEEDGKFKNNKMIIDFFKTVVKSTKTKIKNINKKIQLKKEYLKKIETIKITDIEEHIKTLNESINLYVEKINQLNLRAL